MVKKEINAMIGSKPFAIAIDGGSTAIGNTKVVAITALSPEFPFDLLLHLELITKHETAKIQFHIIRRIFKHKPGSLYTFIPSQLKFMAADGASLNELTVEKLNRHGFSVEYARCVAHAVNRAMVAFIQPINDMFGISEFFGLLSKFIKAGGGVSRAALVTEFGLTSSNIKIGATRWTSFVFVIQYMAGMQSTLELKKAEQQLQLLAKEGDAGAIEALESGADEPQERIDAFYYAVESMSFKPGE